MIIIKEVKDNKKEYIDLLLLADEQEDMIDRYLSKGRMFILDNNGVKGECVVTNEGDGILEIKNIAVFEAEHGKGYGKKLIEFVADEFENQYRFLQVGTGDSPLTIPFYEKCGFVRHHVLKDFFIDNYDHPIIEEGVQLVDMIYLQKKLNDEKFITLDDTYLPQMCDLYRISFAGEPWNDDWSNKNQLEKYIREISGAYNALNYGLLQDGKLVAMSLGMIRHWWEGTNYNIEELCVSPNLQRNGIGKRFMQMIENDIVSRGLVGIFLQTDNDKPAYHFYHKIGFGDLGSHVSLYKSFPKRIVLANDDDKEEILSLYKAQVGREFCPWTQDYPDEDTIDFDLSRNSLFVMKEDTRIIAAISIDEEEEVTKLDCWDDALGSAGELARLAVLPEKQNQGIARQMMKYGINELKERGYKSVRFLVNKHNEKAMRSYAGFEFKIAGECHLFNQDFLCYEKKI